jgi:hypothetical protein
MQIGIIAGTGELPGIVAGDAKERGYRVVVAALESLAPAGLDAYADVLQWVNAGKLGDLINVFKKSGTTEVIMAGKVPKSLLYKSKITPDMRAVKMLFSLKDKSDDSILNALAKELESDGIRIINTAAFSPHLLTPEGVLTEAAPSKEEWQDITFGWKIAKETGKLDIGQTVVVKGLAVMAVEAIEGTDEAIRRGGKWAGDGAVVVKISKPQQDMRLDVPVIGPDTIRAMVDVRARVLAVEALRSIIIDRKRLATEADEAGITLVGYKGPETAEA